MDRWPMNCFYANSLPHHIDELEKIANHLKIPDITVEEFWERLSCYGSDHVPHFGNVYSVMLLDAIESAIDACQLNMSVDRYINGLDTHLYINGEAIHSEEQFIEVLINNSKTTEAATLH